MTSDIEKRLAEAYQARAELAEDAELRAKVDEIPALLHEKQIADQQARVKANLDAATAQARQEFESIAKRMPVLSARLQTMLADISVLAADIQTEQANIVSVGKRLLSAQVGYDEFFGTKKPAGLDNDIPVEFSLLTSFDAALERAGAGNPALNLIPDGLPDWMRILLNSQKVGAIYDPKRKGSSWGVMR